MEKYFIRTFGCKTNQYESQLMKELLTHYGKNIVDDYREADIVVINSCAVTQPAERDVYKFIRRVFRENRNFKKLLLVGCYAEYIITRNLKNDFFKRLEVEIPVEFYGNKEKYNFISTNIPDTQKIISRFYGEKRAYVKIQDGCNNFCSYCIVPYLRCNLYSKSPQLVLKEIDTLRRNKFNEIYFVGINIGKYFYKEGNKGYDLIDLSLDVLKNFKEITLMYTSLEVVDLTSRFFEFLKEYRFRIFPHFHIPLQSADDDVLISMGRNYTASEYRDKINMLRKIYPEVILSCDLIVGYPTESLLSFQKTLQFIKDIRFNWVHVFPYSPRKGTKSYKEFGEFVCYDAKKRVRLVNEINKMFGEEHYKKICKV